MMDLLTSLLGRRMAENSEPDRAPKRFSPYGVWSKARAVGAFGYCLIVSGILLALILMSAWPLLLLLLGFVIAPPLPGTMDNNFTALTPEIIGHFLGSRHCPSCGQSIFDDAPASGYIADSERGRWWPNQLCAGCGHDLKKRLAQ